MKRFSFCRLQGNIFQSKCFFQVKNVSTLSMLYDLPLNCKIPNLGQPEYKPPLLTNTNTLPNVSTPYISPPKNKVIYEYQVQHLNLSKTGKFVDSHGIQRYQNGFRKISKQN